MMFSKKFSTPVGYVILTFLSLGTAEIINSNISESSSYNTSSSPAVTTTTLHNGPDFGENVYDFDDDYIEESENTSINLEENMVEEKIVNEINRRLPEFQQMQRRTLMQYEMKDGRCKSESRQRNEESYYDVYTESCIVCEEKCPENSYYCIAKCAHYHQKLAQDKEIEALQNELDGWKISVIISYVLWGISILLWIFFITCKWCSFDKKIRKLQEKLNQAKQQSDNENFRRRRYSNNDETASLRNPNSNLP